MAEVMLTTFDNPYNPFEQFQDWYAFDVQKGYNTCSYLARIAKTSNELSDKLNEEAIDEAIDEIIKEDFLEIYTKVFKKIKKSF